jgi:hypothetical protein
LAQIEAWVNRAIWDDVDLRYEEKPYAEAVAAGAMALFGEKYGDVVRVVAIPGYSMELCGGTHARNTGQIALFRIVSESGVAAGVRRIEAVTGPKAYELIREREARLDRIAELVKSPPAAAAQRVEALLEERRTSQKRLDEAMRGGGDQVQQLLARAETMNGARVISSPVNAGDAKELQAIGRTLPISSSSTSAGSSAARRIASATASAPSSVAGTPARAPMKAPTGVRTALAITTSVMPALPGRSSAPRYFLTPRTVQDSRFPPIQTGHCTDAEQLWPRWPPLSCARSPASASPWPASRPPPRRAPPPPPRPVRRVWREPS